jgi:hypothetical protein
MLRPMGAGHEGNGFLTLGEGEVERNGSNLSKRTTSANRFLPEHFSDMMKFYHFPRLLPQQLDLRSQLRRTTRAAAAAGVWFPEGVPPH